MILRPFQHLFYLKAVTFKCLSFWDSAELLTVSFQHPHFKEPLQGFPNHHLKAFSHHLEGLLLDGPNLRFYRPQVCLPSVRLAHQTYTHRLGRPVRATRELLYQCPSSGDLRFVSSQGSAQTFVDLKSVEAFVAHVSRVIGQN